MEKITQITASVVPLEDKTTVEVSLKTERGSEGVAILPAGISVGRAEAKLVDPAAAAETINRQLGPAIVGMDCLEQREVDLKLMDLDGTSDRSHYGANAILPISLATARAAAQVLDQELYEVVSNLAGRTDPEPKIPEVIAVVIEGGKHVLGSNLPIQEFSLIGIDQIESVLAATERLFQEQGINYLASSQGGLGPANLTSQQALKTLLAGCQTAGIIDPKFALDVAATHGTIPTSELDQLLSQFPIAIIEDPVEEADLEAWVQFTTRYREQLLVAADDLTMGNPLLIKDAVKKNVANALVVKLNQTSTLSELLDLVNLARAGNWKIIVSHRGVEPNDSFIVDLAVGIGAEYLKIGTPRRPERKVKYDRLAAIKTKLITS